MGCHCNQWGFHRLAVAALLIVLFAGSCREQASSAPQPPADSLIWRYDMGNGEDLAVVSPSVTDGVVYVASYGGRVHALDANTGTPRWLFEADDVRPPALVAGGVVHVKGYALDASTGKVLWRRERGLSPGRSHYFSATKTAVYLDTGLELRALDATSGASLWKNKIPRRAEEFSPPLFPITVADAKVFVSQGIATAGAFDTATGKLVWSFAAADPIQTPPIASDGMVFLRSNSTFHALDHSNGKQLWSRKTRHAATGRPDLAADGVVYLSDSTLRALDASTGKSVWSFAVDKEKSDLGAAVTKAHLAADGMVFVSTVFTYEPERNSLHALKAATGDPVWGITNSIGITPMTVADGIVYAHSLDGHVHAINAWTGEIIWSFDVNYHSRRQPFAVSNGVIYVYGAATGTERPAHGVYALAAPKIR